MGKDEKLNIEVDALKDALARVLNNKPGEVLRNDDLVQCLAFVIGGVASLERRMVALEAQRAEPKILA